MLSLFIVIATSSFASRAAEAACDPVAADNVTAVCTGNTVDQGPRSGVGYGDRGIEFNVTVAPGAGVTGSTTGIEFGSGSVTNYGAITGNIIGISGFEFSVTNYGTIAGSNWAIVSGSSARITNYGAITSDVTAIESRNSAVVNNYGSIAGLGAGISAPGAMTVTNSGTIKGGTAGVAGGETTVVNFGSIVATDDVGIYGTRANIKNYGTVTGGTTGIVAGTNAVVVNSGTVSGGWFGVLSNGSAEVTNSGTIIGGNGTALKFNAEGAALADSLTVLPGARFGGLVDFGGGADRVTFGPGSWILNTANFDAAHSKVSTGGNPYLITPNRIVVADLSGFGAMNRTVLDITGWMSSMLPDAPAFEAVAGGSNALAAIEQAAPRLDHTSNMTQASAFAPTPAFQGGAVSDRDGNTMFAKSFGGRREQQSGAGFIGSLADGYGGALGYERRIAPDIRLGAFLGGSSSKTQLYLDAGSIDTGATFAGVYARRSLGATFLDLALIGGKLDNNSRRNIGGGLAFETARANYGGWFVDPTLALGHRFAAPDGGSISPVLKLRYVGARFDGYSESGSSANLGVAGRVMQAFEERAELAYAKARLLGDGQLTLRVSAGALAQQLAGGSTLNLVLLGQDLVAAAPGRGSLAGLYAGAGVDWQFGRVAVSASSEATAMNDGTRSIGGKGGLHIAW